MDINAIIALVGAAVLAFVVRMANVVVIWLARVLGVEAPDPIPVPLAPGPAVRPPTGTTGANPDTPGVPPDG